MIRRAAALLLSTALAFPALAATRGGTMVFGRAIESQFLDPVHTSQNADIWLSLNLYDTLLLASADGKSVEPGLASAYKVSDDGKTLTFTMRPGLKFSDGSPIEVSDVKWSLDRARSKADGGDFAFLLASIASIDTAAPDQVILHMAASGSGDPAGLGHVQCRHHAGEAADGRARADLTDKSKGFAEHPVGSGPFMLTSWKRNTEMVMSRNPNYWKDGTDGKKLPYLDGIRFVIIPDDATRVLKLRAGELDAAEFVPYSRVAELKADPKLDMELFPAAQMNYFAFNARPTLKDGTKNPLNDVRVRQALNYATDKEALIQVVTYGAGTRRTQLHADVDAARLWAEAALPLRHREGEGAAARGGYGSGFDITCVVLAGSQDDAAKVATLQQLWSQVGVRLKVEQLESATRLARYNAGRFPDAHVALDQRHQRPERDHLDLRLLPVAAEQPLRLGRQADRRVVRDQPGRVGPGQAGRGIQGNPGALCRSRPDRLRVRGAISRGTVEEGA